MRVLVIEDDDAVCAAVRRALLLGGYDVLQAQTGQEGLLRAQGDVPDAIVLDLGLPDIDGMRVCRTLRDSGNRTPILILAAGDAVEDRVDGLEAGADDYLVKPYDVRELQARLKAIMRRHVEGADGGCCASKSSSFTRTRMRHESEDGKSSSRGPSFNCSNC
jgi:DNA-binding response OmpR family regulator